jgi:hypothetical protein
LIKKIEILFALSILSLLTFCSKEDIDSNIPKKPEQTEAQKDSILEAEQIAKHDVFPEIRYDRVKIRDYKHLLEIKEQFPYESGTISPRKILTTLNRQEFRYLSIGEEIIVPDTVIPDQRAYSIFPQYYHGAKDIPKIIMVSNKYQCYACYENGSLVRFAAANTGKERTPTFPGRYALVWKELDRRSSLDSNWHMPYTWNFHALAGNAFHKFDMPGRPVSHSCVRQFMDDAKWLFYWGKGATKREDGELKHLSGTPVIIVDIFDFSRKTGGPWLELKSNKDNIIELPEDPMAVEEALIPWCQIPLMSRNNEARKKFLYAEDTLRARGIIRPNVRLIETQNFNVIRRKKAEEEKKKAEEEKKKQEEIMNRMKILEETFIEPPENLEIDKIEKPKPLIEQQIINKEHEEENNPPDMIIK